MGNRCPQCGGALASPDDSCASRFDTLLALDHSRQEPWGSRHASAFATFALQHRACPGLLEDWCRATLEAFGALGRRLASRLRQSGCLALTLQEHSF